MKNYLNFENDIKNLETELDKLKDPYNQEGLSEVNTNKISKIQSEIDDKLREVYLNLDSWQKTQVARHEDRPKSKFFIENLFEDFIPLSGDRFYGEDKSVLTGFAKFNKNSVLVIGQEKGEDLESRIERNFGMMRPEGYRKAMRIMKLAEKFKLPVVTFMDTPGAFPGIGAEERGQGEAIANNLLQMSSLKVPIVSVVIGEGASGGALGIGVCDRFLMMQNSWYSVISPEGCASILFRDASKAEEAAEALKVTPDDMVELGICDKIIAEPNGGAHRDIESSSKNLELAILEAINDLKSVETESFIDMRIEKYDKLGVYENFK